MGTNAARTRGKLVDPLTGEQALLALRRSRPFQSARSDFGIGMETLLSTLPALASPSL